MISHSRRHSLNLAWNTHLYSCSLCCSSSVHNEMIYSPVFSPQHSSQAINLGFGHHKLYLGNTPAWGLNMTSVSQGLLKPRQLELYQARANPGSKKKGFLLVAPGFCQVAKPLKVKQEDGNRLCRTVVLGGYRLRHSVILNRAILACRASVGMTARGVFLERLSTILTQQSCVSEPLFVHLHNTFL